MDGALNADAILECGVCWHAYDPAEGCEGRDIAPGTAFSDLPDDWRCPSCDAPKDKFMIRDAGAIERGPTARPDLEQRLEQIRAAYHDAEKAIIGLPVHNPTLEIDLVDFREHGSGYAGIVITPWCMNVLYMDADPEAPPPGAIGSKRVHTFPSGGYTFTLGRLDGAGLIETCSLFSPMDEFNDMAVARDTAIAAAGGLFEAPEPAPQPRVTRRFLLTRNGAPA